MGISMRRSTRRKRARRPGSIAEVKAASESQIQSAFFKWLETQHVLIDKERGFISLRLLSWAVPNGAHLAGTPAQRARKMARMKAEGLTPGVPDVTIAYPVGYWHGLYIEFKRPRGRPTPEQVGKLALLQMVGYSAQICYSFDEAVSLTERYVAGVL